jgi:hypothetical protein
MPYGFNTKEISLLNVSAAFDNRRKFVVFHAIKIGLQKSVFA